MSTETKPEGYIRTTFQRALGVREQIAGIRPASELRTDKDRLVQYARLRGLVYSTTPIISVPRLNGSTILYKYESYRPSGSHYDPTYLETLSALELRDQQIMPGDDLYEVSSGSAGTSFAWLCSRLGFNAHIYVPGSLPSGRIQEMINFGAKVEVIGDEGAYIPEASRAETRAFIKEANRTGHKIADPIKNDDFNLYYGRNPNGHKMVLVNHSENGITPKSMMDILRQVYIITPEGIKIDNIVSVIGNGTSSTGLYRGRNEYFPGATLIGLENYDSAVLFRKKYPELAENWGLVFKPQRMFGSIIPEMELPFLDSNIFDEIRLVKEEQARLKMGLHNFERPVIESIGLTSAASMVLAERIADEDPGSITLALVYDGGYRYGDPVVSTGKYDETYFGHEQYRMPLCAPWFQASSKDLASMPHTIGQVFNRVSWG